MPVEGRDLSSRQMQEIGTGRRLRKLSNSDHARRPIEGVTRESEGGIGYWLDALASPLGRAVSSIVAQRLGWKRLREAPCAKGVRFVREPDAVVPPVRFDEQDVETERRVDY
jgi:hypothetical protein